MRIALPKALLAATSFFATAGQPPRRSSFATSGPLAPPKAVGAPGWK